MKYRRFLLYLDALLKIRKVTELPMVLPTLLIWSKEATSLREHTSSGFYSAGKHHLININQPHTVLLRRFLFPLPQPHNPRPSVCYRLKSPFHATWGFVLRKEKKNHLNRLEGGEVEWDTRWSAGPAQPWLPATRQTFLCDTAAPHPSRRGAPQTPIGSASSFAASLPAAQWRGSVSSADAGDRGFFFSKGEMMIKR